MSGTRARVIRADVVAALEGAELDTRAGAADRLRFLNVPRRPESASERVFRVVVAAQPMKGRHNTCDDYNVEFTIEVYYALGPGIEDRISDDTERFWPALMAMQLQSRNDGIMDADPAPLGVEETPHNYIARVSLIVSYRLDSTLI